MLTDQSAPNDEELAYLLQDTATAPDYGQMRPWRWILVHGDQQWILAARRAADDPDTATRRSCVR
ncbi:nitroreductase family protein [Streptomyces sp. NBC_01717]|uniref:nitroreductase family protein n=1 Tax=Streptomyces sp. NBC_01717 TaxID=2975918 RepID=UPI002E35DE70|nr:nitroreductase family protein [Streptomyces sp. NBC_01717]